MNGGDRLAALTRLSCMFSLVENATASECINDVQFKLSSQKWAVLRSSPQMMSFYISLILQVHLTEMIPSRDEAVVIKRRVSREMHMLAQMCETTNDCVTQLDQLIPAIRGLFLTAYQGEEYYPSSPIDFDWSIPHSYYRILNSSHALSIPTSRIHTVSSPMSHFGEGGRIRVAFVSAYFFRHSVGRLMGNMILSLDTSSFHVTIINARKSRPEGKFKVDDLTEKLRTRADEWVDLSHSFDADIQRILNLHSDVLVFGDLLMDAFTAHLVSKRLAPLQVGFWGHPFSAGSTTIDYFISSDGFQEPWSTVKRKSVVSTEYYEQTVLMESFSANILADKAFEKGDTKEEVFIKHHDLGTRRAYVEYVTSHGFDLFNRPFSHGWNINSLNTTSPLHIYTCLQSIMKMHPLFDEVVVDILKKDPNSIIILLSSLKSKFIAQLFFQRRLLDAIERNGADPTRILFMPQISSTVYSRIVCGADVTLDSLPFGGGVTMSDSIRCNVPFVTSGEISIVKFLLYC